MHRLRSGSDTVSEIWQSTLKKLLHKDIIIQDMTVNVSYPVCKILNAAALLDGNLYSILFLLVGLFISLLIRFLLAVNHALQLQCLINISFHLELLHGNCKNRI